MMDFLTEQLQKSRIDDKLLSKKPMPKFPTKDNPMAGLRPPSSNYCASLLLRSRCMRKYPSIGIRTSNTIKNKVTK